MADADFPRRAVLTRLRFESAGGIAFVPRQPPAPLAPPAPAAPAVETTAATRERPASGVTGEGTRTVAGGKAPVAPPAEVSLLAEAAAAERDALSEEEHRARWEALQARAAACTKCPLCKTRTNVVFGEGNERARLVFVGEAPGADEDRTGRPFVGRAGQLLDKIIAAMKLKREDVFICNVLKCRPPGNRTPEQSEVLACRPLLDEQLELLVPEVLVALGSPATKALLGTKVGITQLRGKWQSRDGVPVMPTFHPAYVLRRYTPEVRGMVWADMRLVMQRLGR